MEKVQFHLPKPTGPYKVGVWGYDLVDENRPEPNNPKGRPIPLHVYFPLEAKHLDPHQLQKKLFESRAPNQYAPLDVLTYATLTDFSRAAQGRRSVVIVNHGNNVQMTEYATIVQDLASHGLIVITPQHQLITDPSPHLFWRSRSTSRHGLVIDNLLYLFECLRHNNTPLFGRQLNTHKIALIGHSMGGNAALLLAHRVSSPFLPNKLTLFPHDETKEKIRECIITLDSDFDVPQSSTCPILFCLSEELQKTRDKSRLSRQLQSANQEFREYAGSRHLSFKDHFYEPDPTREQFFSGSEEEHTAFINALRSDIRDFLQKQEIL